MFEPLVLAALCAAGQPEAHSMYHMIYRAPGRLITEMGDPHAVPPKDRMWQVLIKPKSGGRPLRARFVDKPARDIHSTFYYLPCNKVG